MVTTAAGISAKLRPPLYIKPMGNDARNVGLDTMKTVFGSHSNLSHVWAQQSAPRGRSSDGRMLFDGATVYSYGQHFAIARFVERKRAHRRCVLFTTRGYSSSTGKHKNYVRGALNGRSLPVFYVDNVTRDPVEADIKAARADLLRDVSLFNRTTPYSVADAIEAFGERAIRINEMAEFFGLRTRAKCPTIDPAVIEKVQARIDKRDARRTAKYAKRRAESEARDVITRAEYVSGDHHGMYGQRYGMASTFTAEENASHLAAYEIKHAEKVAKWRAGEPVHFGYGEETGETMLRVHGDEIETSRGASFPVSHARIAFPAVKRCHDAGEEWLARGHSIRLGNYAIDAIGSDGSVRAGCHNVPWPEIERAARQLGLIEERVS